jgi:DeoR/GlpR family transcriptional regulator of sugar metabolism
VGADSVTRESVFTTAVDVSRVCQAVLAAGAFPTIVADHSKIGKPSFSRCVTRVLGDLKS